MSEELARAMQERRTRWQSRGLWSQWYDAALAAGLNRREASRFASVKDEDLRLCERKIEQARRHIEALVALGADVPPPRTRGAKVTAAFSFEEQA